MKKEKILKHILEINIKTNLKTFSFYQEITKMREVMNNKILL